MIVCDRCKCRKDLTPPDEIPEDAFTIGYYVVTPPSPWAPFARPGEVLVCDDCMFRDPKYIAVYGQRKTEIE